MSQVLQAMRRQLPAARALLNEIRHGRATNLLSGASPSDLEALLTQFITALDRKQPLTAVSAWVQLAPVLQRTPPQSAG